MKNCLFFLAALALLALFGLSSAHVEDLNDSNFADITSVGNVFVKFYAPWCGHCKSLAPIWEEASHALEGKAVVAKVNCDDHKDLCSQFGVRGFPTLKYFRDGVPVDYDGGRSLEDFSRFVDRMSKPAVSDISIAELQDITRQNKVTFVFFGEDSDAKEAFSAAATRLQTSADFYAVADAPEELTSRFTSSVPAVVAIRNEYSPIFTGPWNADSIASFISANRFEFVPELGPSNYQDIMKTGKKVVIAVAPKEAKDTIHEITKTVAKAMGAQDFFFTWMDSTQWMERYLAPTYSLKADDLPAVVVHDTAGTQYFSKPSVQSSEQLSEFLQSVLAGKATAGSLPGGAAKAAAASFYAQAKLFAVSNIEATVGGTFVVGLLLGLVLRGGKKEEKVAEAPAAPAKEEKQD